ncbi:MAG: hypothetical protein LBV18_04185 [Alistipes sp.]|jgi:hypothetical protein|nr:hypothetical protein [Alistipes sp.]
MGRLSEYIAGQGSAPSRRELNHILDRHEWFTTARRVRAHVTGQPDPALVLPFCFWPTIPPQITVTEVIVTESATSTASALSEMTPDAMPETSASATPAADDPIDLFIEHGGYRVTPQSEAPQVEVDVEIDPDMVTAELAEIYRSQGLEAEAEKIYRTLNLRNS